MPKAEVYPFLYERKGVRFNDGKISDIRSFAGKKIINVIANGFTFKINVDKNQTDLSYLRDYSKNDQVRLRFVHEVKTGAKSYAINDWISISKNVRTYGVINKKLFNKFYGENDDQKISLIKPANTIVQPKVVSFKKLTYNGKRKQSYFERIVMTIYGGELEAEYAEMDQKEGLIRAKNAVFTDKAGNVINGKEMIFELKKGTYYTNLKPPVAKESNLTLKNPNESRIEFSARDSVKMGKDKLVMYLYGKAKIRYENINIVADEIVYNNKTLAGTARNPILTDEKSKISTSGSFLKFDLKGKTEVWQK
ncbi:hypothetical protein [Pedobacter punctiformis]|uniref:Uncharacterized protein n=1 Tax=Pedobacter punctiformis TaxID=3004097 RepID=A0ABT4LBG0_9SPHI|nr:hypothetical protein [Pedobacter sp. HCMS5-2]MCZ4245201.1 hypothetical protein [Pedobacter sp. HCMS5-2]